jgi:hypothetical protein
MFQFKPKSVTLAFERSFSEGSFSEITVPEFLVFEIAFMWFAVIISRLRLNWEASPSHLSISLAKVASVS